MTKNEILTAGIDGWSADGAGVAHVDGMAVFVAGGVPGDRCRLRILKVSASHAFARIETLLEPSPRRIAPDCPLFGKCGGCALRQISYADELEFKQERVREALRRIGGIDCEVEPTLPSPAWTGYRNKAVYQLASVNGRTVFGFYRRRTHEVLPCERCLLQSEQADEAAKTVCALADELHLPVYDEKTRKGSLRRLMVRENAAGDGQLVIVAADERLLTKKNQFVEGLLDVCPWLSGIFLAVNKDPNDNTVPGSLRLLHGTETLHETLCSLTFEVSPTAFFQVNRAQTERLYETAAEYAEAAGKRVLDLYCGAGTLTLRLSRDAAEIIGAEIVPAAVENAKQNAARNGVQNAEFFCGDAADVVRQYGPGRFDVVTVDPPRKGLSPEAVQGILTLEAPRIVYVSCDPATLARDIKLFCAAGYAVQRVQPADMFPRTEHVETVCCLSKNF